MRAREKFHHHNSYSPKNGGITRHPLAFFHLQLARWPPRRPIGTVASRQQRLALRYIRASTLTSRDGQKHLKFWNRPKWAFRPSFESL